MTLAGEEGVGTGRQLLPNVHDKEALISRQTLGYFSTLDWPRLL